MTSLRYLAKKVNSDVGCCCFFCVVIIAVDFVVVAYFIFAEIGLAVIKINVVVEINGAAEIKVVVAEVNRCLLFVIM